MMWTRVDRVIKHSLFSALLLTLLSSAFCQAKVLTEYFIVDVEQKAVFSNQGFFVKHAQNTLPDSQSDIANKNDYSGSGSTLDNNRHRTFSYRIRRSLIDSISWQWLYASYLLIAYEVILTNKDAPQSFTSYSSLPEELLVVVVWLFQSYWNHDSPLFNPIEQETNQNHPFAITTMMYGSEQDQQQSQPSESSAQHTPIATVHFTGPFTHLLYSESDDGNRKDPQQHSHTLGLNCFVHSCRGVCNFRPSSDSRASNSDEQCEPQAHDIDENSISEVASDSMSAGIVHKTLDSGPFNNNLTILGNLSFNTNDFVVNDESPGLQSLLENDQFFFTLIHPKTQQINTESTQFSRGQPHLFQTGAVQTSDHNGQTNWEVTVVEEGGQQRPCGTVRKNAKVLLNHRSRDYSGQQICHVTVVGKDGRQRPCGTVCKNARVLSSHKSNIHSGRKTCGVTLVGADGQQRLCGKVCRNAQSLSYHKMKAHCRHKTCEVALVGEDGQRRLCGRTYRTARDLADHKRREHSGQQICDATVITKDGHQRSCGNVCNNLRTLLDHKRKLHSGQKTCDKTVFGADGQQRSCGAVCKSAQALSDHRRRHHSGQKTCDETVVGKLGQQQSCGVDCRSIQALSDHKRRLHSGQKTCDVTLVGPDGVQYPCGKVCKSAKVLSEHKRMHRKRKPFDVSQDNAPSSQEGKVKM